MTNDEITEKIIRNRLANAIKNSVDGDMKNFKKVAIDALFEYETDKTDWTGNEISTIGTVLTDSDKTKSVIKKRNDNLTNTITKIVKKLEEAKIKIDDIVSSRDPKDNNELANKYNYTHLSIDNNKNGAVSYTGYKKNGSSSEISSVANAETQQKIVGALATIASNEKTVITKLTSAFMDVYKFDIAQARKVYSSAAAYASTHKSVKNESADLIEAIGEAAYYDFMTDMDSIY